MNKPQIELSKLSLANEVVVLALYFNWQLKWFFGLNSVLLGTKFPELNKSIHWDRNQFDYEHLGR